LQNLQFDYYGNRNLKTRIDARLGSTESFGYDQLNRLRAWSISAPSGFAAFEYTYDGSGNYQRRTTTAGNEPSLEFRHDGDGVTVGPHALTSSNYGSYGYQMGGIQTVGPRGGVEYTTFNLPSRTTADGRAPVDYQFDAFRRRTAKSTIGNSTYYAGSGLYEKRVVGGVTRHVFQVAALGRQVAQIIWEESGGAITSKTIEYLHTDHLGSTETVTGSAGTVLGRLKFDPFGATTNPSAPWQRLATGTGFPGNVRHGFTGHEHDLDTGLINARGRMYDPDTGRFLSPDPFVQSPFDGRSYNRFSYVFNNPINLIDPTGFQTCDNLGNCGDSGGSDFCGEEGCWESAKDLGGLLWGGVKKGWSGVKEGWSGAGDILSRSADGWGNIYGSPKHLVGVDRGS